MAGFEERPVAVVEVEEVEPAQLDAGEIVVPPPLLDDPAATVATRPEALLAWIDDVDDDVVDVAKPAEPVAQDRGFLDDFGADTEQAAAADPPARGIDDDFAYIFPASRRRRRGEDDEVGDDEDPGATPERRAR
ncbi:MAG: hypothetical protein KF773_34210 [Deltaproteobacteria bacterium]|nr:hypothetical protein [Deltaproteobacteria bacterium]